MTSKNLRLGALLFAAVVVTAGCRSVSVRGVVQTTDEQPIANASVALFPREPGGRSVVRSSEDNGCFDLFETIAGDQGGVILVVESPGFKPLRMAVAARLESLLLVTLERDDSAKPSAASPIQAAERHMRFGIPCEPEVRAGSLSLH